jgi:hypothetical protein
LSIPKCPKFVSITQQSIPQPTPLRQSGKLSLPHSIPLTLARSTLTLTPTATCTCQQTTPLFLLMSELSTQEHPAHSSPAIFMDTPSSTAALQCKRGGMFARLWDGVRGYATFARLREWLLAVAVVTFMVRQSCPRACMPMLCGHVPACLCVPVCACVRLCAPMYANVCLCAYVCQRMPVRLCMPTYACAHACVCASLRAYVCTCVCVPVRLLCVCVCVCVCVLMGGVLRDVHSTSLSLYTACPLHRWLGPCSGECSK